MEIKIEKKFSKNLWCFNEVVYWRNKIFDERVSVNIYLYNKEDCWEWFEIVILKGKWVVYDK